ncbi:MAG: DUF2889 domain-containing protein [Spirochaetota bacterium]|nr:DUF2889 domain-containing protein [Spirochaetota bacterium]
MITFSRSQLISVESVSNEILRFHGTQEDHIYSMEIEMDVRVVDGVILAIKGWMKRYTTPVCPKAVNILQQAVGISLRKDGWTNKIMREIGRKGCQHFAEIINECGRCLDQARLTIAMNEARNLDPAMNQEEIAKAWLTDHFEFQGSPLAQR